MIALILGGSPDWQHEAAEAASLLNRRHVVVAANLAGIHYLGHLAGWASLHSERLPDWLAERQGNRDPRMFTPSAASGLATDIVAERWPGSSGLFATQVALLEMGATAAILCGVPMDQDVGHFINPGPWAPTTSYRQAFEAALPLIGGRTRSMSGWTQAILGRPTPEWIDAVDNIKPLGVTRPTAQASPLMYEVKNVSQTTQRITFPSSEGGFETVFLAPGESGPYDVDPNQARFQPGGPLTATPVAEGVPSKPVKPSKAPASDDA